MRAERSKQTMIDASVVRVPGRAPRWIVPTVKVSLVIADALSPHFHSCCLLYARTRFGFQRGLSWSESFAPYGALLGVCSLYSAS
jgi:hypothetical protein